LLIFPWFILDFQVIVHHSGGKHHSYSRIAFCSFFTNLLLFWADYLSQKIFKAELWLFLEIWVQESGNMYQQVNKMLKPSSSASFLQNLREKELEPILRKQLVQAKVFIELDHLSKMKS